MRDDAITGGFEAAVALVREGRTDEAIAALEALLPLADGEPRITAGILKYLGDVHLHTRGEPAGAEPYYRRAIALTPAAERASLGLFHALCGQERVEEALDEARRLVTLRPSAAYAQLLAEILAGAEAPDEPADGS